MKSFHSSPPLIVSVHIKSSKLAFIFIEISKVKITCLEGLANEDPIVMMFAHKGHPYELEEISQTELSNKTKSVSLDENDDSFPRVNFLKGDKFHSIT